MIFIDKMKNMKIYKTQTFFPTLKKDKKKGSAILMMTPNYESSKRLMNHPMFVNSGRYISYFLEKDVSYYINSKVVEDIEESAIQYLNETKRADLPDSAFGLPEERKYPLDTAEYVKSAIRLFGHCPENKKHELAVRIMAAAKKFDIEVKETTQVYKYAHQESTNEATMNGVNIRKYDIDSKKAVNESNNTGNNIYFVSTSDAEELSNVLKPRIPDNFMTKNGYEDNKTPRVCFSTSINGCLIGLSQNIEGKVFYVYKPTKHYDVYHPTTKEVPDCKITHEVWIKEPVEITCIGKIKVGEAKDNSLKYTYGDKSAELYDWNWKWENRYINESVNESVSKYNKVYYALTAEEAKKSSLKYTSMSYANKGVNVTLTGLRKFIKDNNMEDICPYYTVVDISNFIVDESVYYDEEYDMISVKIPFEFKITNKHKLFSNVEESCIPKYHIIYAELDQYYTMWKNGTMSESVAKKNILRIMKNNLCLDNNATLDDVPSISEYYSNRGGTYVSEDVYTDEKVLTETLLRNLPGDTLNTGDKVLFFNEANATDSQLKRLLYNSRIKYRRDVLNLLDQVKVDNKFIKYAFPEMNRYAKRNLFVDLYYYNAVFFENNKWVSKKGFNLFTVFMDRLLNHPNLKEHGYKYKTVFIPVKDWDFTNDGNIWNYRKNINPISCIYQMMFDNKLGMLKKSFGDTNVIFVGANCYFKINFSELDEKEIKKTATKFKLFVIKICKNEEFQDIDIDSSSDNAEDKEVIATKIVDKIEKAKGIDLTKKVFDKLENLEKNNGVAIAPNITSQKINIKPSKAVAKNIAKTAKELDDEEDYEIQDVSNLDKDLDDLADAIASASTDTSSEEDALDDLDNDRIKKILVNLGDDSEVDISASRSTRMTKLNDELLKKEINGRSIEDILSDSTATEEATTVEVASPNSDEWSDLTYMNFDKNYNIDKDIVSIFKFFANCTRPIVIRDIEVTDNSTSEDRVMLYNVGMEDYKGRRYRIKLDIPIMEDNRFLLRGNYKSIQTQSFNMPIIKTDLGTCQLISNYNKIFLYRFADNGGKSLPAVSKFIKAVKKYSGNKIRFEYGDNTKVCAKYHLPIDYIDLAGIFSKIECDEWIIYFNQDEIRSEYIIEENKGIPYLYNKKEKYILYYDEDNTFIEILCRHIFEACPEIDDLFATVTRSTTSAYSRASIMSSKIPLALICGYHVGLHDTMNRAGIKYEEVDKLTKEIKLNPNKDWIEFEDGYLVYDVTYESSMLMGGLKIKTCPTELYKLEDMDNKNMYLEFLDNYGGRIKADGLDNFYNLFIDPMIKESLEFYNLPTDYIDILIYGSNMLADNKYIKHIDMSSRRFRRYQLISVYTYAVLSSAYGRYANEDKHTNNPEFAVKQSAVIDKFLTDTISSDDSCINALRDIETTNAVTTKGPSGMNSDRAYSLDKRTYDESMINVLGMSTGFAGNVGVTRQTTIDANINQDGYVKSSKDKDMNDANTLTATESLIPFGSTRDDPMRTAMSFIQTSKHMVRTEDSDPLLVTSGADEVIPYITTNKFAFKAKDDGVVLEVTDDFILVQYKDGSKDYISLKETTEKNSDGGYFVSLKLDATEKIKPKYKFKKNEILAYDRYSFSNKLGESDNIAYNIGKLAKVAILNTDEGFEDSGIISSSMAKKLATRIEIKFDATINKDSRIYKIAKVGDHIEASDDLIIWEDAFDDADSEELMNALSDGNFSELGKRKLKSEVTGVLKDIKIYRTVDIDELSKSVKKVVTEYEKPLIEEANYLKSQGLSTSIVPAHYKLEPTGKLKKSQEAILIEFYVEYLDTVGVGDKVVYNSANKAVEKTVLPEGKEPYTAFRPNEIIDAMLSSTSIDKRLVTSTYVYGSLQKLMIELDRSVKDIMGIPYDDSTV